MQSVRFRFVILVSALTLALLTPFAGLGRAGAAPEDKTTSVRIYLVAVGDNGRSGAKIGCGDSLVAVTRPVQPTSAPLNAAYRVLLANHDRFLGQSGLYNSLYRAHLTVQRAVIVSGEAKIYLAGRLNLGGECDNPRVSAQLKRTAFQFPSVHGVYIYINGVPLRNVLSLR